MPKKIGPEAKIIALFTALPDDSKRIVMDVIRSQAPPRPKASSGVQPVGRKSSRKDAATSLTASTGTDKEGVSSASKCGVLNCGLVEDAAVHSIDHEDYHIFRTSLKKAQGATA